MGFLIVWKGKTSGNQSKEGTGISIIFENKQPNVKHTHTHTQQKFLFTIYIE